MVRNFNQSAWRRRGIARRAIPNAPLRTMRWRYVAPRWNQNLNFLYYLNRRREMEYFLRQTPRNRSILYNRWLQRGYLRQTRGQNPYATYGYIHYTIE
jgi:hypothetical protein